MDANLIRIKIRKYLLVFVLLCIGGYLGAQVRVEGMVTDATGETLVGVSVVVNNTTTGATTDLDGKYQITVPNAASQLKFSYIGYTTQLLSVPADNKLNVVMQEDANEIDEVVVVGYGVQRKSHLTGSISKLNTEGISDLPVNNMDQALQGKIAGVSIQNTSAEAGAPAQVRVRGMGSISASNEPLVVVDGFPMADGLQFVNMNDVASVEVLKDAASSAIYGSRGANGVIMITTKSGSASKPKYNFLATTGFRNNIKTYDIMTTREYTEMMYNEAALRAADPLWTGTANRLTNEERAAYIVENDVVGFATDWQKEALRNSAQISNYQLSVSGGSKDVTYFLSANYSTEQGAMYHSQYDRFTVRSKIDANLSKNVKVGLNISPTYTEREVPGVNFTNFWRWQSFFPVKHTESSAAFINEQQPSRGIKVGDWSQPGHFKDLSYSGLMPDGNPWSSSKASPSGSNELSPKSAMERMSRMQYSYRLQTSAYIQWQPIKNLILNSSQGVYLSYMEDERFQQTGARSANSVNEGEYGTNLTTELLSENTANYILDLGDHNITFLGGFTFQKTGLKRANILATDFASDDITTISTALSVNPDRTYTTREQSVLISYLGRVNYAFKDKYLLSVSARTDGSSKFYDKKWGFFPSVALGWMLTQESFMQGTSEWLKSLKLRASYGVTGNNDIDNYAYVDQYSRSGYVLGKKELGVAGFANTSDTRANQAITWEQTDEYNVGVDAGFLNNRITLGLDLYNATTRSLLFEQAAMSFTGFNKFWNNIGKVRNRGIEVEIGSSNITAKDFTWKTNFNISHNQNRLMELGGEPYQLTLGERSEVYAAIVGQPSIQFYGYKTDGVWKSQEEIKASGLTGLVNAELVPGELKLVNTNNEGSSKGVIDEKDRVVLGDPFPDFEWSMINTFTYKAFDFSFMVQGSHGADVINGDIYYNETRKYNKAITNNRWVSPSNPGDGQTPNFLASNKVITWMLTDYVIEDGSFVALREATLGYTLPQNLMQKVGLSSLRLFVSGQNLLYFMGSSYRGVNPEARTTSGSNYGSPLVAGYQRGAFPVTRTIIFGLNLNF